MLPTQRERQKDLNTHPFFHRLIFHHEIKSIKLPGLVFPLAFKLMKRKKIIKHNDELITSSTIGGGFFRNLFWLEWLYWPNTYSCICMSGCRKSFLKARALLCDLRCYEQQTIILQQLRCGQYLILKKRKKPAAPYCWASCTRVLFLWFKGNWEKQDIFLCMN